MERKLVLSKIDGRIVTAVIEDSKIVELHGDDDEQSSFQVGDIYIGKVKNLVKNIQAAFIEIRPGMECYYSMTSNPNPVFTNKIGKKPLCIGDELLVQIEREAVKTKAPTVTSGLNFTGKYAVLTHGNTSLGISSKIQGEQRQKLKDALSGFTGEDYGFIIRTNAKDAAIEEVTAEMTHLLETYRALTSRAKMRTCFSCMKEAPKSYLTELRNIYQDGLTEILVEDDEIYEEVRTFLAEVQPEDLTKLVHYEDRLLPLHKLYSVEHALSEALKSRVWMKSGAYLVIEPTEAMTVVDVNSGKCVLKKEDPEAYFKVNVEAAKETARQMRLRNLSGIIMIDFINMKNEGQRERLMEIFAGELRKDPVRADVIDMTKLQLVEVTRRKVRKPLHESFRKWKRGVMEVE